jgi:hypothetical protein
MPRISFAGYMACDDPDVVADLLRAWLGVEALDLKIRLMGWEIVFEAPGTYVYCYDALNREALLQGHFDGEVEGARQWLLRLASCLKQRGIAFRLDYVPVDGGQELTID